MTPTSFILVATVAVIITGIALIVSAYALAWWLDEHLEDIDDTTIFDDHEWRYK